MMVALREEVQVHLAHDCAVAIGILHEIDRVIPAGDADAVIAIPLHPRKHRLKKPVRMQPDCLELLVANHHVHLPGVRTEKADDEALADAMRTENTEGIRMRGTEKRPHLIYGEA